ncbi:MULTISPECIES: hypothetical protein [Bacillus cereus group]|uniref:hypothetical protein n=1 Tax=Bacillus cereus group TaxID=86661 RepID=UPI000BF298CB|nr:MULTISPECIES: hypothetical protein [Bacillus cereus group]PEW16953.1 hypothetical protein CN440_01280 [Bacillus cereus]PFF24132.1 hypothetical protein CN332_20240 [Bacillus thuringiensis]
MDKLIKEIMSSLDNKNYLSALALTLTLPDICGKIAYPEIKGYGAVGKRYAQWYNEYIHKFENLDGMEDVDRFDGDAVYKLRCNFLHDGSSDIREYMRGKYNQTESKDFVFELTDTITSYSKDWEDNEDDCNIRIQIGVIDFCRKMCWTAENFYNKNSEQDIFNNIIISDDLYKVLRLNDSNKA